MKRIFRLIGLVFICTLLGCEEKTVDEGIDPSFKLHYYYSFLSVDGIHLSHYDTVEVKVGNPFYLWIETENEMLDIFISSDIDVTQQDSYLYRCFPNEVGTAVVYIEDHSGLSLDYLVSYIDIVPLIYGHMVFTSEYEIDVEDIVTKIAIKKELEASYILPISSSFDLIFYSWDQDKNEMQGVMERDGSESGEPVTATFKMADSHLTLRYNSEEYSIELEEAETAGKYYCHFDLTALFREKYPDQVINSVRVTTSVIRYRK